MSDTVLYEVVDNVATVTINRPDRRNALNSQVVAELTAALQRAGEDQDVRVVVLTGAGDRAFSAGGDLAPSGAAGGQGPLGMHWDRSGFVNLLLAFSKLGKPVVGRVNGHALGGGFGLMLACDIVIARDDAKMGTPEINVGLFPMMIMALIVRNIPRKLAVEMMLTGEKLLGAEALAAGIINRAVPGDQLDAEVAQMVDCLKSKSPAILRLGLEAFHNMSDMALEEALRYLQTCLTINTFAEDAAEGVMAFIQKRQPEWKGR